MDLSLVLGRSERLAAERNNISGRRYLWKLYIRMLQSAVGCGSSAESGMKSHGESIPLFFEYAQILLEKTALSLRSVNLVSKFVHVVTLSFFVMY